ncbi:MAG: histidinol dehydrogenase [Cyclobacteriaceae bacterium]
MNVYVNPPKEDWEELLKRPVFDQGELEDKVSQVLKTVKKGGDAALKEFTKTFDQVALDSLIVSEAEIATAHTQVDSELKSAIDLAIKNITLFHEAQVEPVKKVETMPGVVCWRENRAIDKVGLYVPGGTAPLFSTVLMLGIPAKIAGCQEIVLCTPPQKEGSIHPAILYAAHSIGVTKIIKVGGAQAIAAMTYGTESVPSVFKIFGPGNQYVTCAKQLITREGVAIDMPAGPSEVAVMADDQSNPVFVASDLLSQAEHGKDSQVILLATSEQFVEKVQQQIEEQLKNLPRAEFAQLALRNSKAFVISNMETLLELTNQYAAEHLVIHNVEARKLATQIRNAGSVFIGPYTPESAGDYASGTNHTLPTNGYAKAYSGVSIDSFIKKVTFQEITKAGLSVLGPIVEVMSENEQLIAHQQAVSLRLK